MNGPIWQERLNVSIYNDNQDRHKKVKFDKNATVYLYDKENEKEKKPTDKNSKKEKIRNINEYHK